MINYAWGAIYHNQVGTHEFIDFCRQVNAEPFTVEIKNNSITLLPATVAVVEIEFN